MQRIEANRPDPEAALECRGVGLPRRILHPTDLSETAARAMPWLGGLAKRTSVEISLLHVLDEDEGDKRDGVILGSQSRQVLRRASARMLLIPAA
jgi:nucleotide-binding universal stress UspA family protein